MIQGYSSITSRQFYVSLIDLTKINKNAIPSELKPRLKFNSKTKIMHEYIRKEEIDSVFPRNLIPSG